MIVIIENSAYTLTPEKPEERVSGILFAGLLLFFLFEYTRPGTYVPALNALKANTILPITVFVLTVFSAKGRHRSAVFHTSTIKWFLLLIALLCVHYITADVKLYVHEIFKATIGYLFIYFVIIRQVTDLSRIKAVFFTLVLIHVLLIILNPALVLQPESRNYIAGVTFLGDGNDL